MKDQFQSKNQLNSMLMALSRLQVLPFLLLMPDIITTEDGESMSVLVLRKTVV